MARTFKGSVAVGKALKAGTRVDQAMRQATIVATETLTKDSIGIQRLKNVTSALDVIMPDATTLFLGWTQKIINDSTSTFALVVKDGGAGATLKSIDPGEQFSLVCTSIGATAGAYKVVSLNDHEVDAAARYTLDFTATTEWGAAAGGVYTQTILGATHGRGLNPIVQVFETATTTETQVEVDYSYDNTTGDVSISADEVPDCRFAGRIVIV